MSERTPSLPSPLPHRDALARLAARIAAPALKPGDTAVGRVVSMQDVFHELIGPRHLWWHSCQEAVRFEPTWLLTARAQEIRAFINDQAPDRGSGGIPIADPAYVVSRSLALGAAAAPEDVSALRALVEHWAGTKLLLAGTRPGQGLYADGALATVEEDLRRRLDDVFSMLVSFRDGDRKPEPAAISMVALTALLLAGPQPLNRPVVRVSVVFARPAWGVPGSSGHDQGVSGVLELREFPAGPEGLYPDPQAMAGARSAGSAFQESLNHAWEVTAWPGTGRCVLWRIVLSGDLMGPPEIDGGSLGAAFALGLRELFRRPRSRRVSRVGLYGLFYGLRSRTAVTGVLKGGERLEPVSGIDAKLQAVRQKRWRLVAPEPNRKDVHDAADRELIKFAETLKQADKYARQWRTGRVVTAAALVVVLGAATVVFSRYVATNDRVQAASQLAAVSGTLLNSDVDLAQLFAVEAYRDAPDAQARAALFQAVTASPHFVRSLVADGPVSATATATDGRTVVAATQTGLVQRWTLTDRTRPTAQRHIMQLPGAVKAVAVDAHGDTVAAMDTGTIRVWSTTPGTGTLHVPSGQQPEAVGVSPSGRFVAMATSTSKFGVPPNLLVLDRTTGRTAQVLLPDFSLYPTGIVFPDDGQLELFDGGGYGTWEHLSLPDLTRMSGGTVGFGVHNSASAISADGRYISYTNGDTQLPLWATDGTASLNAPSRVAQVHGDIPNALALSSDASRVAQAADNTIYVSQTVLSAQAAPAPVALTSGGPVTPGSVAFLGNSGDTLISASGNAVNLWDLTQPSRIANETSVVAPFSCDACPGPYIGLQPNGPGVAVVGGNGDSLDVQTLNSGMVDGQWTVESLLEDPLFSPPLWLSNADRIIVVNPQDDSAKVVAVRPGLPVVGTWAPAPNPLQLVDKAALLRLTPDGQHAIEVDNSGTVKIRTLATGSVVRQVNGPADMAPTAGGGAELAQGSAAVDDQAAHTAVIDFGSFITGAGGAMIAVTTVATGRVHVIDAADVAGIAYIGDQLLVQRKSGVLEIWAADGSSRIGAIRGVANTVVGPIGDDGKTIVEVASDGTAQIIDYPSGNLLGTLTLPTGSKETATGLAFSTNGNDLVTATEPYVGVSVSYTGELIDWRMNPQTWTRLACDSAGRDLTPAEWTLYMKTPAPTDRRCER